MEYKHQNKEALENIDRKNITDYVKTFLLELAEKEKRLTIRVSRHSEAERIKGLLNIPRNTTFKSMRDIQGNFPYWNEQSVDYVPSNLGRGYIFYFICSRCKRRVKYLYEYSMLLPPLCRHCCRLQYRRQKRKYKWSN